MESNNVSLGDRVSEAALETCYLTTLGFLAPHITFLGTLLLSAWNGFEKARSDEFIQRLQKSISDLGDSKVDKEYLQSEEFYDLLKKSYLVRMQHRCQVKADFIYALLTESISRERAPEFTTDLKEQFLGILDQLYKEDLFVVWEFALKEYKGKSKGEIFKEIDESKQLSIERLYLHRILIDDDTWDKNVIISLLGEKFVSYLKELATKGGFDLGVSP